MAFINSNYSNYFNAQNLHYQYPSSLSTGLSTQGLSANSWLQNNWLSSLLGSSSSLGQNWSTLLGGNHSAPPPPPPPPPVPPGRQQNGWPGQQTNWGGQTGHWGARQALGNCQTGNSFFGSQQVNNNGQLSQAAEGEPISYTTSGGWTIDVNGDKTTFTDPTTGQTLQYSGDPHEYLNGEHVKDWESKQRTVQLPDGTKVTLSATAANGLTTNTSIYDGNRNIQIDNTGNLITSDSTNYFDTQQRESSQYDGEVARLGYNQQGGLIYTDLYNQDENFQITSNYKDIARSDGNGAVTDLG
ncbi:MAG: DUF1521 domain-containing protein [Candidatus Eremiobacteraeota bacterium]|nr:DUF1521 domain-containing protein [Candidatus Eremiobacteraeota bacterium]MCW5872511.1 DUF1521 domain-containing protein [Candidatus Eremiobacteraeota bacterium]